MSIALFARQFRLILAASLCLAVGWVAAGRAQTPQRPLPLAPQRERGASITPAYEGWYENKDGSFSMLLGYYNRNQKETLDIPVGPNNRVDPGGPDQGQPTHFESGRQWGVFVIKVPKDFGTKAITWTIVANGESNSIPLTLNKGYPISPFEELGMHNKPPVLAFSEGGAKVTGPPVEVASTYTGTVNQPVAITVWAEDVKVANEASGGGLGRGFTPSVATISLHKFRGPGKVTFDKGRVPITTQGGSVAVAATFDAPGDYTLRVQANDESGEGGGGFQCCWTNTYVKVTVRP
jgi:hypothetical protein